MRSGLSGRSWSLAIRMVTGSKSVKNVAQHRSRPHEPMPPCTRAESRAESCRSSTRQCSVAPRSRTSDRKTIYFTAPHLDDFRSLVRDQGANLHCLVELRQQSARDSARVQGGIGSCGRDLCCATFLTDFEPVTIRMAKDQDLPLNPLRISGACGRLMCCLKYEHPLYQKFQASAPAVGTRVTTPEGDGRVVGHSVPKDAVVVRMDADGSRCSCSRASVCGPRQSHDERYG